MLGQYVNNDHPTQKTGSGPSYLDECPRPVNPYHLAPDRRVLMGVAVPEVELLGDLQRQRLWMVGIALIVLVLAVGRATLLAMRYSRPIDALVEESDRISEGDLEPGGAIDTRVREVHRLAEAHDRMRVGLRQLLKIERDLRLARKIQQNTYPDKLPSMDGFDLAAWSEPAEETGGDNYDLIGIRDGSSDPVVVTDEHAERAVLLLADATGHGIGPALSVTQIRAMLRIAARNSSDLVQIVTQINEQLCDDLPAARFITAWLGSLDASDHTLRSIAAGQAPILRYEAAADTFHVSKADAMPLGMFESIGLDSPEPVRLDAGDIVAVMSDGIFEAADPDGEQFGCNRVTDTIRACRGGTAEQILATVREAVDAFTRGHPPDDDRTMIIVKRVG